MRMRFMGPEVFVFPANVGFPAGNRAFAAHFFTPPPFPPPRRCLPKRGRMPYGDSKNAFNGIAKCLLWNRKMPLKEPRNAFMRVARRQQMPAVKASRPQTTAVVSSSHVRGFFIPRRWFFHPTAVGDALEGIGTDFRRLRTTGRKASGEAAENRKKPAGTNFRAEKFAGTDKKYYLSPAKTNQNQPDIARSLRGEPQKTSNKNESIRIPRTGGTIRRYGKGALRDAPHRTKLF